MINFVIINGVNSNTINGLGINELPPISKPPMRVLTETIDGRDGDITTDLGYNAYDKTFTIGLFGTGYDINDIISFFNREGTIVFSNEPDKYYKYKIIEQIDYEKLLEFKTASVRLHCQPFKYPLEEDPLEIEYEYVNGEGESITLNNTGESTLDLSLKGNTSQTGEPTPSSPIPINVVSGDNEVVVCGKNLFDKDNANILNAYVNASGTIASENSNRGVYLKVSKNTDYSMSMTQIAKSTASSADDVQVGLYESLPTIGLIGTRVYVKTRSSATENYYFSTTFNTGNNEYVFIKVANISRTELDETLETLQLEKGSTATTYEPYQSQTYPINLGELELCKIGDYQDYFTKNSGKNLLNLDRTLGTPSDTTASNLTPRTFDTSTYVVGMSGNNYYYPNNVSSYSVSDNAIKVKSTNNSYGLSMPMKLDKGTYKLSFNYASGNISFVSLSIYDSNNLCNSFTNISSGGTFTIDNDNTNILLTFKSTNNVENTYTNIILINGTEDIPYEPYGTGQWCKYNAIKKIVLDGTQELALTNWRASETSVGWGYSHSVANSVVPSTGAELGLVIANKLREVTYNSLYDKSVDNGIGLINNPNYSFIIRVADTSLTTNNAINTYLSSNPIEVYYVLATPYLSLIEDETLIEQLDNLENAMSYEGQTNVMQNNNDLPFIISAKALELGSDEITVNNIGNIYSKPLIALEGNGIVNIYLNDNQVLQANVEDKMNIDIDTLEAYNPDTSVLLNRQVTGNYNSMTIPSGESTIKIDGSLDKATITNYTRWL